MDLEIKPTDMTPKLRLVSDRDGAEIRNHLLEGVAKAIEFQRNHIVGILGSLTCFLFTLSSYAQINNSGCVTGGFGIDGGLYSNIIEFGMGTPAANSNDWFYAAGQGGTGSGVLSLANSAGIQTLLQGSGNPTYETRMNSGLYSIVDGQIRIDAVFARDQFGGTGGIDNTSFVTASKNGEDPANWAPGPANVLGKNDLIDMGGFMFRDNTTMLNSDLWFIGLINRAEPGGAAYMDFEFFVQDITYNATTGFDSAGPDMGHTAFQFDASGNITRMGDFIMTFDLESGGTVPMIGFRIWMSRADFIANKRPASFTYSGEFDGAVSGSAFGYAKIVPANPQSCGYVNVDGQNPTAPPWGTKNTKSHVYGTSYIPFSVAELGVNMTKLGIDPLNIGTPDPCKFAFLTFLVKTRSSAAFSAQLKDFAGPFGWGQPDVSPEISGNPVLSCSNPTTTLTANPLRTDVNYTWSTVDGNIIGSNTTGSIVVNQPGTYQLQVQLQSTGCYLPTRTVSVGYQTANPFFSTPTTSSVMACGGNDGQATVNISGATSPYSFAWSNNTTTTGSSSSTITGLSAGTYTVTITDSTTPTGCTTTASVTVGAKVTANITPSLTHVTCPSGLDGSISLVVTGRTPYTFQWSNGNRTSSILNLAAGTYTVTLTDADGCTTVSSHTINQPAAISASISAQANDTDPDPMVGNGSITLSNPSGGTPSYTYAWSGPGGYTSTVQSPTGLKYGEYTVVITDMNGCTFSRSTFIYEPEICNDGIDNDGDGLTNCFDPECIPVAPTAINNPAVCVGVPLTYTATPGQTYDSYDWLVPTSATITSAAPHTGASITVNWTSTAGGQICVRGKIFDCYSSYYCITVAPQTTPSQLGTIINN